MYMYHVRLMMNFIDGHVLNLPHFLLASLKKMSVTVQKHVGNIEPHLYHHGLIRILIEEQLKKSKDTWDQFLTRNYFQEPAEASGSSPSKIPRKSRRRDKNATAQDSPLKEIEETAQKEEEDQPKNKKQQKEKGKVITQEISPSPEKSLEEDYQRLSERLVDLKAAALAKKQQKGKQSAEKTVVSSSLRRSSRLKGKWKKTKGDQSHIIDLSEEILEKSPE